MYRCPNTVKKLDVTTVEDLLTWQATYEEAKHGTLLQSPLRAAAATIAAIANVVFL